MPKTIKSTLLILLERVKISQLKNKIRRMERISYLNLSERMELRDAISLLQTLEQHQQEIHNTPLFSLR